MMGLLRFLAAGDWANRRANMATPTLAKKTAVQLPGIPGGQLFLPNPLTKRGKNIV